MSVCRPQVPSQCVESQSFTTPPVYSPGKQGSKTATCSVTASLTDLDLLPKRPRGHKKTPEPEATGRHTHKRTHARTHARTHTHASTHTHTVKQTNTHLVSQ